MRSDTGICARARARQLPTRVYAVRRFGCAGWMDTSTGWMVTTMRAGYGPDGYGYVRRQLRAARLMRAQHVRQFQMSDASDVGSRARTRHGARVRARAGSEAPVDMRAPVTGRARRRIAGYRVYARARRITDWIGRDRMDNAPTSTGRYTTMDNVAGCRARLRRIRRMRARRSGTGRSAS